MLDLIFHRLLRLPYTLHVQASEPAGKPRATILFLHGIGNSGEAWSHVTAALPKDLRLITIDLLGFGKSPQPTWVLYNAKTQARSVHASLLKLRIRGPIIVVGHSLGALVAIELAKRHPKYIKSLILCSPPLYQPEYPFNRDRFLREIFRLSQRYPERFVALSSQAKRYGLVNKAFSVSTDNVATYMKALEATIINQRTLEDAKQLELPITIIHGKLDPVVIPRNLKSLAKGNPNVTLKHILAGHEVHGRFIPAIVAEIEAQIKHEQTVSKNPI
jgi:cis-3-alkyl-4-acyloxetan-2-one decarboxylase